MNLPNPNHLALEVVQCITVLQLRSGTFVLSVVPFRVLQRFPSTNLFITCLYNLFIYLIFLSCQITLSAKPSKDADYERLAQASPKYYWFCRNSSEPEFDTSGNLDSISIISIPELNQNNSEVNLNTFPSSYVMMRMRTMKAKRYETLYH